MNLLLWIGVVVMGWLVVSMLAGAFLALGAAARRRRGQDSVGQAVVLLPVLPRQRCAVESAASSTLGSTVAAAGQSAGGSVAPDEDRTPRVRGY